MKNAKYFISFLLYITFIVQIYGQDYDKNPHSIYLDFNFYFLSETLGEIESIDTKSDKNGNRYWVYKHIFGNKQRHYASLRKYKNFISFLNKEVTYKKIVSLGKKYGVIQRKPNPKSIKRIITFKFHTHKDIHIVLDSSSIQNPTIHKIVSFFKDYRQEYGCEKRYYTYQLKKGENIETIAERENVSWYDLYDFNYNYEHKIGVTIYMFNKNVGYTPKAGDIILLPCFLNKK